MELEMNRSLLLFNHDIPIGISVNKWNSGVLNKSWQREFYWVSPEDSGIFELYRIGVPITTLLRAGYEKSELLAGGYSEADLESSNAVRGLNPSEE
jgi:hypothetical protein